MDRITAREMQGFTMHDRAHGLKVAHLMWHILKQERQQSLTPAEIGLMVTAAHLHDLGMGLSDQERAARLHRDSDLWEKLDPHSSYFGSLERLAEVARNSRNPAELTEEALYQVQQAQEALLCNDTRERHASRSRYQEILRNLQQIHTENPVNIIDPQSALSFDGDQFTDRLIEICVSHNESAHALLDSDPNNIEQDRFPTHSSIGCCIVNTRLVAATLRLADILDFDRERTPPVLFHYLLPRSGNPVDNVSVREWSKHLAISNWSLEGERVVFRGKSSSAIIHHTIVEFCKSIEDEIKRTKSVFSDTEWSIDLKPSVDAVIETIGYRYIPYKFSLDENRIYELLMGDNIYRNRLDAIRELIQNAVDACRLRDSLMICHDQTISPSVEGRIIVRYEEPISAGQSPILSVIDTGIGMDRYVIENYFLKVGRSYYKSSEFLQTKAQLRKQRQDFVPIAEFGIGLMAIFMLGDRVEVETAPWLTSRRDNQRRLLRIDGLGRLIEVSESENFGSPRYYGTRISVYLVSRQNTCPSWKDVECYIREVCKNISYPIVLEHVKIGETIRSELRPEGLKVPIPPHLYDSAFTIPVDDPVAGIRGEIVIYRSPESSTAEQHLSAKNPIGLFESQDPRQWRSRAGVLLRCGFAVGHVPGLPDFVLSPAADARIEVVRETGDAHAAPTTDLGRSRLNDNGGIGDAIFKAWFTALVEAPDRLKAKPIGSPDVPREVLLRARWLNSFNAFDLYCVARSCWPHSFRKNDDMPEKINEWERGVGPAMWVSSTYERKLVSSIFSLLIPKISSISVGTSGNYYASPPKRGWQKILKNWYNVVDDALDWPNFATYLGNLDKYIFDCYGKNRLNIRYVDNFKEFDEKEISLIPDLLETLCSARDLGRTAYLDHTRLLLANKMEKFAPNLIVRRHDRNYFIKNLVSEEV